MTKVQNAWKNMRIDYQIRYARMCRKVKENEFNTDNHGALMEMSYVLILPISLVSVGTQLLFMPRGISK